MSFWLLFLHVLGACIWVGGHLYLAVKILPTALREHNTQLILNFESSFEKMGMMALATQIVTGLYMAHIFLPDMAMLANHRNPIVILICLKISWLILTAVTAMSAQLIVIPKLKKDIYNDKLRKIFVGHILVVTTLALLFVMTGVMFRTGLPTSLL